MENKRSLTLNRIWLAVLSIGLAYVLLNPAEPDVTAEDLASVRASIATIERKVSTLEASVGVISDDIALFSNDAAAISNDIFDMMATFDSLERQVDGIDRTSDVNRVESQLEALRFCLNTRLYALDYNTKYGGRMTVLDC